jgi:hypothetical protein
LYEFYESVASYEESSLLLDVVDYTFFFIMWQHLIFFLVFSACSFWVGTQYIYFFHIIHQIITYQVSYSPMKGKPYKIWSILFLYIFKMFIVCFLFFCWCLAEMFHKFHQTFPILKLVHLQNKYLFGTAKKIKTFGTLLAVISKNDYMKFMCKWDYMNLQCLFASWGGCNQI